MSEQQKKLERVAELLGEILGEVDTIEAYEKLAALRLAAAATEDLRSERDRLLNEVERLRGERDTPETQDFLRGVALEADHQVARWGVEHDAGKQPEDWFWLLGYLGGKALAAMKSGELDKAAHHTISSAAMLLNWHRTIVGKPTTMRPGIDPPTWPNRTR